MGGGLEWATCIYDPDYYPSSRGWSGDDPIDLSGTIRVHQIQPICVGGTVDVAKSSQTGPVESQWLTEDNIDAASCRGLPHLLNTLKGQLRIARDLCPGCPLRIPCGEAAVESVHISPNGEPEAWIIQGGMLPNRIIAVWQSGSVRVCRRCDEQTYAADWIPDRRVCVPCATPEELEEWVVL